MSPISTVILWKFVVLLKAAQFSTEQFANTGQLTLEPGETLLINTSEPSASVIDNKGNRTDLLLLAESNHSFINQLGDSREWKYGVARLVFVKDIILNSNSTVNISGENALSVESLEGNIVLKTMIDLSCAATELDGKCVGGYMPIGKPKDWLAPVIPGNGPGGTSENYLMYWYSQCIGGSGHGGKGGYPAFQDVQVKGYSGLEYGKKDTHVLLGGSSESKIKANAQQTQGNFEIYSGSSGGLIRLEANEVQVKNGGSLEVNGAHAGQTGHTQANWTSGSAGGAGGIVHILASGVFLSSGSISLKPGNSTGCTNVDRASPGFLSIRDHSGHHSMSWNNDTVFPINPEGFSWPSASSKTVSLPPESSTFIVALIQPSLTPTKTGSSTFPIASFSTTEELIIAASYSSDFPRQTMLESHSAVYTSSVADLTSNQLRQFATDVSHYSTATKLPTELTVVTSASPVDTASEWEELLKNVTFLKITMGTSHNNFWIEDIQKLAQRFQTLVEKETLMEESVERFLQILNEFSIIVNIIPGEHQETMKSVAASLMTTAEFSFEMKNEDEWKTTDKLPTVLRIVENITLALGKTTTENQQFKFEHYSQRTVVQVVTFKNNGDRKTTTHFMLPDITRTNLTVWEDIQDAVLIPLDGQQTFKDEFTVSIIIHRNISNILPTGFTERTEEQDNDFKVASHIISCSILYNSRLVTNMTSPVELHFHHPDKRSFRSLCVFWDPRVSAWSTDGVRTLQVNKTHTSCHSTHLTSFAILTQFKEVKIPEDNELALSIITYIGCGLSIACLFVTLLVYLAFE
ncbi:uncharacterized protein LOC110049468 isoform X2 [Orbicella faveolata]|uniref:uncharacterized protein LOC110049468 isoform X2 n=1 Tax=Orbicella faveolata TaxID=48498 RepID=UPI0009E1B0F5|nr:uncharacterized protein LOC110049468 isoform X2 [Orbicella faveolata]